AGGGTVDAGANTADATAQAQREAAAKAQQDADAKKRADDEAAEKQRQDAAAKKKADDDARAKADADAKKRADDEAAQRTQNQKDKDVDAGTSGTVTVPKLKAMSKKMRLPQAKGRNILHLDFLLGYKPQQQDISNTRATRAEFDRWYAAVQKEYELDDTQMTVVMSGLMVWCIENGCSPNINGVWTMMDGEEQRTFPLKPIIENASPTFRQIMHHFSDAAEAYIEYRNSTERYMPRYGLQRNLTDFNLARYAFDFYEITSRTTARAKEAHMQMKAAAVRGSNTRMFGLDGNVGESQENTERHTAGDVSRNMHTLLGVQQHH
nr:coat protein [Sorghum mosaic virus]